LPNNSTATVEVDMDDLPGVWTTTSHKGIVSCNQLVRQTVPMIADAVAIAGDGDRTSNRKPVLQLAAMSLTTHATCSLLADAEEVEVAIKDIEAVLPIRKARGDASSTTNSCEAMAQRIASQRIVPDFQSVACRTWRAEDYDLERGRLVVYLNGWPPGEDIKIWATSALRADGAVEVSALAVDLPDMLTTTSAPAVK
jgi:hypothetical protein